MNSGQLTAADSTETLAPIIRPTPLLELGRPPANLRFLLIGFAVAAFMHIYAVILLPAVLDIEFDDDPLVDLINDEIGIDPDVATNYNVDRIEEINVPGPAQNDEVIWVPSAPVTSVPDHDDLPVDEVRNRRIIVYTK
jgi:hypothetical protein